jgi:murein DD-endopeptidase MepM/ murein hydrolase activator NlpD
MARQLYHYNPRTCRYEPVHLTGRRLARKSAWFIACSVALALTTFFWYIDQFTSLEEQFQFSRNKRLHVAWNALHLETQNTLAELTQLAQRDDQIYRTILDLKALSPVQRQAGVGGRTQRIPEEAFAYVFIRQGYEQIEKLSHQTDIEKQSLEELAKTASTKSNMWATRPAIQPVSNTQLDRLHTTFGMRLHPIFKTLMDHKGLDFTAGKGTPVYATGNARVSMAYFSGSYGNVVYLDHGYDYETRYAHLSRFVVHPGQFVKRGELIGYVGNTGVSVSPHLHYEVLYKNNHVNPIHFFQRDLNNAAYQQLIDHSGKAASSLD